MNTLLQLFLIICTVVFSIGVLSLLLKNKISERYSVIWLAGTFIIILIAGNPKLVDKIATLFGIAYPPSLLFFLSTLILFLLSLYQTIQITKLTNKVKDISQYLALHQTQDPNCQCKRIEVKEEYEYKSHDY